MCKGVMLIFLSVLSVSETALLRIKHREQSPASFFNDVVNTFLLLFVFV